MKRFGGTALIGIPGRAPLCLRCKRTGQVGRECRVPKCPKCFRFGHSGDESVRTYDRVAGALFVDEEPIEHMINVAEVGLTRHAMQATKERGSLHATHTRGSEVAN